MTPQLSVLVFNNCVPSANDASGYRKDYQSVYALTLMTSSAGVIPSLFSKGDIDNRPVTVNGFLSLLYCNTISVYRNASIYEDRLRPNPELVPVLSVLNIEVILPVELLLEGERGD